MGRQRKLHLLLVVFLAVFSTLIPQEKSAVLCFDNDGDPSVRETGHFICKDFHSDFEISDEEVHDHDHCNDVELPSFFGKIQKVKTFVSIVFEPFQSYYKNPIKMVFFRIESFKPVFQRRHSYRAIILSKAVVIC